MIRAQLTVIEAEPREVAWYLVPGWKEHTATQRFLTEGGRPRGIVVNAGMEEQQHDLRIAARELELEVVLDPLVLDAAFDGGAARGIVRRQPWSMNRTARPRDLRGTGGAKLVRGIVDAIGSLGCDAVISPSHYLSRGLSDPWWPVDYVLCVRLRRELDRRGLGDVRIYYRLSLPLALLRADSGLAGRFVRRLRKLEADGLWLLMHPAGLASSGPQNLRAILQACADLHRLRWPVVMERAGLLGQALVACGGAGGVTTGVASRETFDVRALEAMPSASGGFAPAQRVYVAELFSYLLREDAMKFFENRLMRARYGCQRQCCRGSGPEDSIRRPPNHYLFTKEEELRRMTRTPEHRRVTVFTGEIYQSVAGLVQATGVVKKLDATMHRLATLGRSLDAAVNAKMVLRYDLPSFGIRGPGREGPGPKPHIASS